MFNWNFLRFDTINLKKNYNFIYLFIYSFIFIYFNYIDLTNYNPKNVIYTLYNNDNDYYNDVYYDFFKSNYLNFTDFFYKNFLKLNLIVLFNFILLNLEIFTNLIYFFFINFFQNNFINNYELDYLNFDLKNIDSLEYIYVNKYSFFYHTELYLFKYTTLKFFFNEYLYHIILYSFNLPIFFYFGCLFIFTTIFSLIFMSYLGLYGVFLLNFFSIILFWISTAMYINIFFIDNIFFKINLGKWFIININYTVFFELLIDSISYSFMFLTLTIAVFVYIYAFSYFRYEPNVERLIILINCFVISMVCLVTSGNFFVLFLGWELIGLTSFFLINFWSTRISTLKAAFKAFSFNKFSDVSLLIAILLIFFLTNDLNIVNFNLQISNYNNYYLNLLGFEISILELISFFMIGCAFVKSAQFGFHIWLPDSMEAPVPASALIHSATLVSAGVFILLRLSFLFEYSLYAYYIIPIIGSFTAFFGGLCSVYQSDIKKILAYSTISHCGFLMVCYSTYISEFTILYLYIHGFFKASVFLCVGNIIRFSKNYQDFRRMGQFWKYLPFECFSTFICLINLCGLPFTIGFYIKHLLVLGFNLNIFFLYFILINVLFGAISGLFYSYRLFYNVFFDFKKSKKILYNQSNRLILKSYYYSNTSLASNFSILFLIVISYLISLYLFNIFLNSSSLGEGLDIYSVNSTQYDEFNYIFYNTVNNIGYFNWFLFIIILIILLSSWRKVYNYYNIYNVFYIVILFNLFLYFFY